MLKTSILFLTLASVSLSTTPNPNASVKIISDTKVYVPENIKKIGKIKVDNDENIKYTISGGIDKEKFIINGKTGELYFKINTDYEAPVDANKKNKYHLTITINNTNGMIDKKDFEITVLDLVEI